MDDKVTNKPYFANFHQAAKNGLEALQSHLPFGLWMFTKADTETNDWHALVTHDTKYNVKDGDIFKWTDSFCSRMVEGLGPKLVPDTDEVDIYKYAPISSYVDIKSYIGLPLYTTDKNLFGTLCAIDTSKKDHFHLSSSFELISSYAKALMLLYEKELNLNKITEDYENLNIVSQTDHLTRTLNQRGWNIMLSNEESRVRRYNTPCAIAIVDMNNLKEINDEFGHSSGDREIIRLSTILQETVRSTDFVARIGGDEFGIYIYNSNSEQTDQLINRIKQKLNENKIDAAVGYCHINNAHDFKSMQESADLDMYKMKSEMKDIH